jgi:hypothetical protein
MFKTIIWEETNKTATVPKQINGDNTDNARLEAERPV